VRWICLGIWQDPDAIELSRAKTLCHCAVCDSFVAWCGSKIVMDRPGRHPLQAGMEIQENWSSINHEDCVKHMIETSGGDKIGSDWQTEDLNRRFFLWLFTNDGSSTCC
jgi:hypothetical protein